MSDYTLYVSKNDAKIVVKKASTVFKNCKFTDDVVAYNDCYYFSTNRKKLIEKAKEIKNQWVEEARKTLEKYESIEIR